MRQLLKDLFFFFVPKRLPGDRAAVLMYHSISERKDFFSTVTSDEFERQMAFLAERKIPIISLTELIRRLGARTPLGGAVVITFDDGYRDNYTAAFPVLKHYGFPATIFVATDYIGTSREGVPYLSEKELREMQSTGLVDIEPHTKSHARLSKFSAEKVREEIIGSKQALERILEKRCDYFAPPYGAYTLETVETFKSLGFAGAVTVKEGTVHANSNPFELPRNSIDVSTTMNQFHGKISTAIDAYHRIKLWG